MEGSGHVQPAKLVDRRIDARACRLLRVLRVYGWICELQLIVNVVGRLAFWLAFDREAREVTDLVLAEVESEQRLGIAASAYLSDSPRRLPPLSVELSRI